MLNKALTAGGEGGGIRLISDFTSVECVSKHDITSSVVPVVFSDIPETSNVMYGYFEATTNFVKGNNYNLENYNKTSSYALQGVIYIDENGTLHSEFGAMGFQLSGSTLTSNASTRNNAYGLFKINK